MYGFQKQEDQIIPPLNPHDMMAPGNPPYPTQYPQQQPPYPGQPYGQVYPPQGGGYPPQGGGYPPQGGGYPPQGGAYPPQSGGYPPQGGGYPPQGGYAPQGGYPPPGGAYPYGGQQPYEQNISMQSGPYRAGRPGGDEECNPENFTSSFTDPEVRRNFVKKVYLILFVQLGITAAIAAPFSFVEGVQQFAQDRPWFMFVGLAIFIVTQIMLVCCESLRRQFPTNFILLFLLTIGMSIMVGFITVRYRNEVVITAFGLAAFVCLGVSLIAWFCPFDITACGKLMCVLGIAFMIFGLVSMVMITVFKLKFMMLVYAGIAVALFSLYLMFDTQQIMGGKRVELSPEEYVLGALQLYIDMVEIFINLLPLVAACFGDD